MPQGPWQGVSWEGAGPFQWEGPVPRLLPGLRPPIWCRWHRTTLTGWAERLEAQPSALLLFLLPSSPSCSSSWTNVGKRRPLGQPQFPADSKHSSTLCASSPAFPQAPENNPTQINHYHGLTPNPFVVSNLNILESFIVFSTLWALSTPVELWIIQTERGKGWEIGNKRMDKVSGTEGKASPWALRRTHREIRKKRWVFVNVWVCLSGREREEEKEQLHVCTDAYLWVCLHTSLFVFILYTHVRVYICGCMRRRMCAEWDVCRPWALTEKCTGTLKISQKTADNTKTKLYPCLSGSSWY